MTRMAFDTYVAPARAHPQVWRLIAGLALTAAIYVGVIAGGFAALSGIFGRGQGGDRFAMLAGGHTPASVVFLLFSFLAMAAGPLMSARWLHRRGAVTLIGPPGRRRRDFLCMALVILAAWLVLFVASWAIRPPEANLAAATWLFWLPLALVGLLVQTGAEEVVFRGYMQQQLAARFRSPLVWMVLPSAMFGLLHLDPEMHGGDAWLIVAATAFFGVIAADLTARTGSLAAAWGLHFGNNVFAILVLSVEGQIDGLSLFSLALPPGAGLRTWLVVDIVGLAAVWVLCRRVLRV